MENSINERVKRIMEIERFRNPARFAAAIGVTRQSVSSWLIGKPISGEKIEMILKAFPNISEVWLRHGIGDMYSGGSNTNVVQEPGIEYEIIQDINDVIRDLKNEIQRLRNEISKKELYIRIIEESMNPKK